MHKKTIFFLFSNKLSLTLSLSIYIYIYKCKLLTNNLQFYTTNWFKIFSILFEFWSVFIYLLSKNITIIKKIFLISRFSPRKAEHKNILPFSKNFTRDFFFCIVTFLSFLVDLNRDTKL